MEVSIIDGHELSLVFVLLDVVVLVVVLDVAVLVVCCHGCFSSWLFVVLVVCCLGCSLSCLFCRRLSAQSFVVVIALPLSLVSYYLGCMLSQLFLV